MKSRFIIQSIKSNNLFKDSLWAVMGNGIGNFLMLFSGILIAKFLGKDLYGEYSYQVEVANLADYGKFRIGAINYSELLDKISENW